ncbi:RND transporter [Bacillus atrophaeus ATCC 9372]
MKKSVLGWLAASVLGASFSLSALAGSDTPWVQGMVKKVDASAQKITIKHQPLTHLNMPAMTMGFQVAPEINLDQLEAGSEIEFKAVMDGSTMLVTELKPKS